MIIELTSKMVYGTPKYYPSNSLAVTITKLLGQKTLTISDLKLLDEHFYFKVDGVKSGFVSAGQYGETVFLGLAKD